MNNVKTVHNTAYMQWRPFVRIIHLISPNLCVPGPRLHPRPATAHTPERCKQVLKTDSKPKLKIT
jgi:hypothetical protein